MPWWALAMRLTGIGWYMAVCILAGVGAGILIDRWAGTGFVFILVGTLLGTILAFFGVYRMVLPFMDETRFSEKSSGQGQKSTGNKKDQV